MLLFAGCAIAFDVPTRAGLMPSEGERLLSGAPNREASTALESELASQGFDMTGVDVWVLPVSGQDTSLGFVVLDESQGFTLDNYTLGDPVTDSLVALARSGALQEAGVSQVGMEYVDADGDSAATLTVRMDSITAVANGQITAEEFARQVEGRVDMLAAMEVLQ
jgi:hypothetical protein